MNQPLSGSGGTSLRSRQTDNASPTPSDDSDTDISLGTHSPVPSSLSLQHSPGSTSGGGNDDRLLHGKFYSVKHIFCWIQVNNKMKSLFDILVTKYKKNTFY